MKVWNDDTHTQGVFLDSPQRIGLGWVWCCSARPPQWLPPRCNAPPPVGGDLSHSPSPTDVAATTHTHSYLYYEKLPQTGGPILCFLSDALCDLNFRDGDSCFRVFVQHQSNELLQLITNQWPVKITKISTSSQFYTNMGVGSCRVRVEMWTLTLCSRIKIWLLSNTNVTTGVTLCSPWLCSATVNVSWCLLTSLETPQAYSWFCCAETQCTHHKKGTGTGHIKRNNSVIEIHCWTGFLFCILLWTFLPSQRQNSRVWLPSPTRLMPGKQTH